MSPATLTCPEIAATTGSVLSCAARGTVSDSATKRGSQRHSRLAHVRAHQMIPPLARTDRANPTERPR